MTPTNKPTVVFSAIAAAAAMLLVQFLAPKAEVHAAVPLLSPSYKVVRIDESFNVAQLQASIDENTKDGWHLKQIAAQVAIYER